MARNPLELLKDIVSPQVVSSSDHDASSKSALLAQFYPILLSVLSHFPERIKSTFSQDQSPLSTITGDNPVIKDNLLKELSRHHSLPTSTIEPLLNHSIPLSIQTLQDEVGIGNVGDYLREHLPYIAERFPAWAAGLLGGLGLTGILASDPVSQHVHTNDPVEKVGGFFRKILPWIALAILMLLFLFFWRTCQQQTPQEMSTAPMSTASNTATTPANLSITSGEGDELLACKAQVGDQGLASVIKNAVSAVFGAEKTCNTNTDQAYATSLTHQDKMQDILGYVKAIPNASLQWDGDQVTVNAPNADDVAKLVDQIKAIAPDLTVTAAAPLDVKQSVTSSIDAAKAALAGLNDSSRAEDVARALNLQIINFDSGSANIPDQNKEVLDLAATLLQKLPQVALTVGGFTDSTGNADQNKALSDKRAKSVVDYLVSKGASSERLTAVGYGQENPVADNVTEQGKFRNRRIEFAVTP